MQVKISASASTAWHEYAIRFLFGGVITAIAGIIARQFGPGIGGLFLAFPAIFPASVTLVEKHEKEKKEKAGFPAGSRGRKAAAVEAAGTVLGTIGLMAFALSVWRLLPSHPAWLVLAVSTLAWLVLSALLWVVRKRI